MIHQTSPAVNLTCNQLELLAFGWMGALHVALGLPTRTLCLKQSPAMLLSVMMAVIR